MMTREQVLNTVEEVKGLRFEVWANMDKDANTLSEEKLTRIARYYELYDQLLSDEAKVFKCDKCGEMIGWYDLANDEDEHLCINCAE